MKHPVSIAIATISFLVLTGCAHDRDFVGDWGVTEDCQKHTARGGHGAEPVPHLAMTGKYRIRRADDGTYRLEPESGPLKSQWSACPLTYEKNGGRDARFKGTWSCGSYNPGNSDKLTGTCPLDHNGTNVLHDVKIYLVEESSLYGGKRWPAVHYFHPTAVHDGWLH